ncbi:RDD family protein [Fulvivirga sp. 29W222]|uniref:RDD family protein n=1 Tax=Fulvivirga marina TaxID=2494733 RepID=A0A937KEU6_9BACT|nr:RDD family protein [Fulvivirga marina]MBL6447528.1 RDD family protein [Fulvivirga marina]
METTLDSPVSEQRPVEYAGFWLRFVAYIIDAIILSIGYWIIISPLLGLLGLGTFNSFSSGNMSEEEMMGVASIFSGSIVLIQIVSIILYWLYFALMESSNKQATVGKMALGLVVTDMHGNKISFGQATGRYFGKIISGLILAIGYIMAGFTEKKQALHDMLAGTLVVKK